MTQLQALTQCLVLAITAPDDRTVSVPIRHPSTLMAPVPYCVTFAATVPVSGLRARMMGSHAGLSAVPHPCQRFAASVAGAVMSHDLYSTLPPIVGKADAPAVLRAFVSRPTTSRSASATASARCATSGHSAAIAANVCVVGARCPLGRPSNHDQFVVPPQNRLSHSPTVKPRDSRAIRNASPICAARCG